MRAIRDNLNVDDIEGAVPRRLAGVNASSSDTFSIQALDQTCSCKESSSCIKKVFKINIR
jgi:hypothetical protein